ncbi:MAG: hypothetical protein AWU59_839 [Methanolobus sp. T82-4]|nr:MAG: hypothetical protein AWU59_839 [Methanolobus sp. T82-4]
MVTECLNREETFLIVVPTNKIAQRTILEDVIRYSHKKSPRIIQVTANKLCMINQQKCADQPQLEYLQFLPLPRSCKACEYYKTCVVTNIHRVEEFDGIAITYDKLVALMRRCNMGNEDAEKVIEKLSFVDNIIFDEVHTLQYATTESLPIYSIPGASPGQWLDTQKYSGTYKDFPRLSRMLLKFENFIKSSKLQTKVHELIGSQTSYFELNPRIDLSGLYGSFFSNNGHRNSRDFFKTYSEIIGLIQDCDMYGLSVHDVLILEKMLQFTDNHIHILKQNSNGSYPTIDLVTVTHKRNLMLREFCMFAKSKRIILASATICSFDYQYFFDDNVPIEDVMFGPLGDPMNNNSQMLILTDTKKYHAFGDRSFINNMPEIIKKIVLIFSYWGADNCLIVAANKKIYGIIRDELEQLGMPLPLTYYNSDQTIGVSSNARVMINVGLAYKPSDAYDMVSYSRKASLVLREESVHCDTWQAMSRVKDPNGKQPSVVFALGCTYEDCWNTVEWGEGRTVDLGEHRNGEKRKVVVATSESITRPCIKKCKDFDTMLIEAAIHTQNKKVVFDYLPGPINITYNYSGFNYIPYTINNKCDLLGFIAQETGKYFSLADSNNTNPWKTDIDFCQIESHLGGEIALETYTLSKTGKVTWICLTTNQTDEEESTAEAVGLRKFLTVCDIPFVLEAFSIHNSYRFWIFLQPINAKTAKKFGKWIMESSGVKCKLYPGKVTPNKQGLGDLLMLPFAKTNNKEDSSSIWIHGRFEKEFKQLTLGVMDISELEEVKTENYVDMLNKSATSMPYTSLQF